MLTYVRFLCVSMCVCVFESVCHVFVWITNAQGHVAVFLWFVLSLSYAPSNFIFAFFCIITVVSSVVYNICSLIYSRSRVCRSRYTRNSIQIHVRRTTLWTYPCSHECHFSFLSEARVAKNCYIFFFHFPFCLLENCLSPIFTPNSESE